MLTAALSQVGKVRLQGQQIAKAKNVNGSSQSYFFLSRTHRNFLFAEIFSVESATVGPILVVKIDQAWKRDFYQLLVGNQLRWVTKVAYCRNLQADHQIRFKMWKNESNWPDLGSPDTFEMKLRTSGWSTLTKTPEKIKSIACIVFHTNLSLPHQGPVLKT